MTDGTQQLINALARRRWVVHIDPWDEYDPVVNALLVLIEAQNVVQSTFNGMCEERDDGTFATRAEMEAALDARSDAVLELLAGETAYWRGLRPPRPQYMDIHQKQKLGTKRRKFRPGSDDRPPTAADFRR